MLKFQILVKVNNFIIYKKDVTMDLSKVPGSDHVMQNVSNFLPELLGEAMAELVKRRRPLVLVIINETD